MPVTVTRNNNPVTFRIDGKSVTVKSGDTLTDDMASKLANYTSAVCFICDNDKDSVAVVISARIFDIKLPDFIDFGDIKNIVVSQGDIIPKSLAIYASMVYGLSFRAGI